MRRNLRGIAVAFTIVLAGGATHCVGEEPDTIISDRDNPGNDEADAGVDGAGPSGPLAAPLLQFAKSTAATEGPLVAVDGGGNIILAFTLDRASKILDQTLALEGDPSDVAVVKFAPAGTIVWQRVFGGTGRDGLGALAVEPGGDVFIAGSFTSPDLSFGAAAKIRHSGTDGRPAPYVARLRASDGEGLVATDWTVTAGATCTELAYKSGVLAVGCNVMGDATVPTASGSTLLREANGSWDVAVVSLDAATLKATWATRVSSSGYDLVRDLAFGPAGDIYVGARFPARPVTGGGVNLTQAGRGDAILRLSDSDGALRSTLDLPDDGTNYARIVGLTEVSSLKLAVVADVAGRVTLGTQSIASAGKTDVAVGRLSIGLELEQAWMYGGPGEEEAVAITQRDGRWYVAMNAAGDVDVEGVKISGAKTSIVFEATPPGQDSGWARRITGDATAKLVSTSIAVDTLTQNILHAGVFMGTIRSEEAAPVTSSVDAVHDGFLVQWKR